MRTVFRVLLRLMLLVAVAYAAIWALAPQLLQPNLLRNVNAFRAAEILRTKLDADVQDNRITLLQRDNVGEQDLFHALEATWPYAFSLRCTTHSNGLLSVEAMPDNLAAQQQAALLAKGIVQNVISKDMILRDRLKVLHDYLIQHCIYDVQTAKRTLLTSGNGTDSAFTAAGALVDGKAVCSGYSRAYMMLCAAAGIDMVYIADNGMNHGWNAVRLYDTIYYIDTTFDDPVPDRGAIASADYFLIPVDRFSQTHRWDKAFYDELMLYALPESLAPAQRLFDLGLLTGTPPMADSLSKPLAAGTRQHLESVLGISLSGKTAAGECYSAAWTALSQPFVAEKLVEKGIFTKTQAISAGVKFT